MWLGVPPQQQALVANCRLHVVSIKSDPTSSARRHDVIRHVATEAFEVISHCDPATNDRMISETGKQCGCARGLFRSFNLTLRGGTEKKHGRPSSSTAVSRDAKRCTAILSLPCIPQKVSACQILTQLLQQEFNRFPYTLV